MRGCNFNLKSRIAFSVSIEFQEGIGFNECYNVVHPFSQDKHKTEEDLMKI